ncbi:MAG TPA: hypothetical protein VF169_14340 [Albitalea sp.]|uniref:hypothetical protein n=1 Tax=Piscinibacter sp. TaxID=1903157 RepID=UPI002ED2294E
MEQYLLAFLFLFTYAFALSDFTGARGRLYAVLAALASAIAFAARTDPWENGVLVVAFALVAMGLFSAVVWGTWVLLERRAAPARIVTLRHAPEWSAPAQSGHAPLPLLAPAVAVPGRSGADARLRDPRG